MRFLIPSYGRCGNVKTLEMLRGYGVDDAAVTISTQTASEFEAYSAAYPRVNVVYREARNYAGNANTLLATVCDGEPCFLMDDDVSSVAVLSKSKGRQKIPYGFRVASREAFLSELRAMAAALERDARCRICTAYPKNSNVTVSGTFARDGRFSRNALSSTWLAAVKPGLRFDEGMDAKEDYELQIRELAQGRSILRDNLLAPNTASRITAAGTKGGRGFTYGSKQDEDGLRTIAARYPGMVSVDLRRSKIRLVNV